MGLRDEIFEQPAVLRHWLETRLDATAEVAAAIRARDVEYVVLAARGTSDNDGIYEQYA
jgi:glutamine---fructose-6-phosphate transaminase (isomerizing)